MGLGRSLRVERLHILLHLIIFAVVDFVDQRVCWNVQLDAEGLFPAHRPT